MPDAGPAAGARPLRVLHVRNSDLLGGPERLILDQVLASPPGFEHVLLSFGREGKPHPFLDAAAVAGIRTVRVLQSGSYDPRLPLRLRRAIADVHPDVLVGHDYKANLLISLGRKGAKDDHPAGFVAVVHGYTAEDPKIAAFEAIDRRVLRNADAVVAVSEAARDALVASGVSSLRVRVIENGVAADRVAATAAAGRDAVRAEWRVGPKDVLLLCLGRVSPEKGQDVLLDAFVRLASDPAAASARLVFAGDGALRPSLESRVASLVAGGHLRPDAVQFAGWRSDPHECLGAADVFVLPSRREGLPVALLEAMAAGVAIVATDVGGVSSALDSGKCGVLVPADDPARLATALFSLVVDPSSRALLVGAAAARVRSHFSVSRQSVLLSRVYSESACRGVR